jgi:hypothetical protein
LVYTLVKPVEGTGREREREMMMMMMMILFENLNLWE